MTVAVTLVVAEAAVVMFVVASSGSGAIGLVAVGILKLGGGDDVSGGTSGSGAIGVVAVVGVVDAGD